MSSNNWLNLARQASFNPILGLMHVTAFYQQIVVGVVIILTVLIDRWWRGASS